jgi:hypothetical protein
VVVEAVPIPPISPIAPIPPIDTLPPLPPLPIDPLLPKQSSYIPIIADIHPLEPIPTYPKPSFYRPRQRIFKNINRNNKPIKYSNTCHKPVREIIPNAVCPTILPKHICEVKHPPKISVKTGTILQKPHFFMVSYHTFRIAYTFGLNTGYTRANAYMEAARCLRFFLARDIQILDKSMGIDVYVEDICEFVDFDDDDDTSTNTNSITTNTNTTNFQPVFNITHSNVTISNTPSRNVVYDNNDDLEFVFESPEGTFGVPSAGPLDDDIDGLDFGDIIEI